MKVILETKRLILREYCKEDFNDLALILMDKETMKHYPKPYDENGVNRWINWNLDNYEKYGFGLWALILKENGKFIGDCGITMQQIDNQSLPEIGYHINKNYWRQGYGSEACKAVKDWAFKNKDFPALYSYMNIENIASYSLAKRNGMQRIGQYHDDRWNEDLYIYKIDKETWEKEESNRK